MLDADDAILEQAMQTGAALKRARDLQKAARKPKVITHLHLHQTFLCFMLHDLSAIMQLRAQNQSCVYLYNKESVVKLSSCNFHAAALARYLTLHWCILFFVIFSAAACSFRYFSPYAPLA